MNLRAAALVLFLPSFAFAASGSGYAGRLTIRLAFKHPIEEDLHLSSFCDEKVRGTRSISAITQVYGGTLDPAALLRFR
ncbi:MAG: hypothetical protein HY078_10030 [Elusimicrobia bacterium]|nr:hypothetical protein [Elusimicrobiota bacterium]